MISADQTLHTVHAVSIYLLKANFIHAYSWGTELKYYFETSFKEFQVKVEDRWKKGMMNHKSDSKNMYRVQFISWNQNINNTEENH